MQGNLPDENVIGKVLDAAVRAELKYKSIKKKRMDESIERMNRVIEARKEKEAADLAAAEKAESKSDTPT
jgi:hypothetical protein